MVILKWQRKPFRGWDFWAMLTFFMTVFIGLITEMFEWWLLVPEFLFLDAKWWLSEITCAERWPFRRPILELLLMCNFSVTDSWSGNLVLISKHSFLMLRFKMLKLIWVGFLKRTPSYLLYSSSVISLAPHRTLPSASPHLIIFLITCMSWLEGIYLMLYNIIFKCY